MKYLKVGITITLALVLIFTTFAFAESLTKNITVEYKGIKFYLDGIEVKLDKEPFIYEGTVYAPVNSMLASLEKVKSSKINNNQPLVINYYEGNIEVKEINGKKYVVWGSILPALMKSIYRAECYNESNRIYKEVNGKREYVTGFVKKYGESKVAGAGNIYLMTYEDYKNQIEPLLK